MHRKFAAWLSEHPWGAAFSTAVFGVLALFGLVPGAIAAGAVPTFVLLHKGVKPGLNAANVGSIWIGGLILLMTQSALSALATVVTLIWLPLLLGLLLRRYSSLTLCFQVAVLAAVGCLGVVYLLMSDPTGQWREVINGLIEPLKAAGVQLDDNAVSAFETGTNWGTYFTLLLLSVMGALFLGRWWHSLLEAPGAFGAEYRQLRLGTILGAFALVVVLGALVLSKIGITLEVLNAWMWIAVTSLAFQGLSAAHKLKAVGIIGRGWLTAMYVLLIVPLSMGLMVIVLAGWGLADNLQRRRTPNV